SLFRYLLLICLREGMGLATL
ncbi:hypothetical protein EE612_050185, partial [Oryza sativa]